jgi:fucose 4-O-acetylase-like acetyltransferase
MIQPAIYFIYPFWKISSVKFVVDSNADPAGSPWVLVVPLVLIMLVLIAWDVGRSTPRSAKKFVSRKFEILTGLFLGWWWFGFATDVKHLLPPELLVIPFAILLYAALALIWVHRSSEVRRFWRQGARIWLWLVLPVEAGVLLALGSAVFEPGSLSAWEGFFLLAMAVVFPYLISRQQRTEGGTR